MQERTEYNFISGKKKFPTQRKNFLYFSTKKSIFLNEKKFLAHAWENQFSA